MKTGIVILGVFLLGLPLKLKAQEAAFPKDPDRSLKRAMELAGEGKREEARDTLRNILAYYPEYTDVSNLLAKTYSWDGDYTQARNLFNRITSSEKSNKEVWEAAIRNEIYAKNKHTAIGLANKALIYLPEDADLRGLRNSILESWDEKGTDTGTEAEKAEEQEGNRNFVALFSSADLFDVVFDPMYYTGVEFNFGTDLGKIIPRINYSNRFGIDGIQYELDLYPKFSKSVYAYINYGYSQSEIYPEHRVGGDLYVNLPGGVETSLGARYLSFTDSEVTIFTGSAGLYKGNYYFSLRPYVTPRNNNTLGISGVLNARRYLKDANNYIGLTAGMGFMPEFRQFLANSVLVAETLLFVESQQLLMEYQFSFNSNPSIYRIHLGLTRQEFVFAPGNFFWAFSAGLRYQVGF
ncbi:outer membrane protein, YaiO family [Muriicola jejuensis]|uniref:YaiO family outer membrane beta-barrel protein n=1 Tax=Muriicola jejuensis TaxID=504488 RepID=A0A6P0UJM0_9FLAO|nr:YaiO family outer membrane beta-barrel protein [Muriicola jejuensis]NER11263.1 YaiO family outer membrane beta-barrel protein [Muriicola jejuensis]SMP21827.1 outer membrane protein, YaiO family [Muriicola jejuensis]